MATATEFSFGLREVTAALLERQGIKSGKWRLKVEFDVSTGTVGEPSQEGRPGAMLQISRVQLVNVPDEMAADPLVVDASVVTNLGGLSAIS